ncbi:uncharacterized protein CG5098 [Anopheles nili]|uniref:uncharacterized protein CG5098 n=1 Tax=Anopheles nili TaxID=185578 RepID=UPI00237B1C5C|nr:uncharacterized protein CG5098 [Anopheles nili]
MSGHNPPHGRLGQPNTTWNPLQVPSYVPRQPQLAHMSSERSMARSPLTWATPPTTHQDKVYSLMTGNLMNNLEINPLLQGYGRTVGTPLGTVDLSLSSASRSTPSPKGTHNNVQVASTGSHSSHASSAATTLPSNIPTSCVHNMASDSGPHNSNHQTRSTISPNVVPSSVGVIQSTTTALKERIHGPGACLPPGNGGGTSNNFPIANPINDNNPTLIGAGGVRGGNGFGTGLSNRTANDLAALVTGGLLIKDAKQINSEMENKNGRDCFPHLSGTDPSELVKEFVLQSMHCNSLSVSPKRASPVRSSGHCTLSPSRSRSPPLNLLLGSSVIEGKLGVECLSSSFPLPNSRTPLPLSLNSDSIASTGAVDVPDVGGSVAARAIGSLLAGSGDAISGTSVSCQNNPSASPTGNSMTSSEDSVDSSNSRSNNSRRRRKPEKTNKMNAVTASEDGNSFFKTVDGPTVDVIDIIRSNIRSDITALAIEGINALSQGLPGAQGDISQNPPPANELPENSSRGGGAIHHVSQHSSHDNFPDHHTQRKELVPAPSDQQKLLENLIQSNVIPSSNTTASGTTVQPSNLMAPVASGGINCGMTSSAVNSLTTVSNNGGNTRAATNESSLRRRSPTNLETDEGETIDTIAAMVASSNAKDPKLIDMSITEPLIENGVATPLSITPNATYNGPASSEKANVRRANTSDSSYEEVENKLEEMFAGIEEQSEKCAESAVQAVSHKNSDGSFMGISTPENLNSIANTKPTDALDGDVAKQLSNSCLPVAIDPSNMVNSDAPAGPSVNCGKKPLTPAQKRALGAKSGEMVTSTPATKRKRGPKKKSNTHGKPSIPFMEAERSPIMGLKALAANKKKSKKAKTASPHKNVKGGAKGKSSNGKDQLESAGGAVWSAGNASSIDGKYKGPYVQVKSDGNHTVINAPINEEDGEKAQNKTKKFGSGLNSTDRSKIRGLHVSTLSTKYDADTTDTSWMCVFCKIGPHKFRLGDLFGPYIISTSSTEYTQSQIDVDFFSVRRTRDDLESQHAKEKRIAEKQKEQQQVQQGPKSKKRKNAAGSVVNTVPAPCTAGPSSSKTVTLKEEKSDDGDQSRSLGLADIFYGMNKASDHTYEVWTHEDCLVWAPGVYMVGTRVVGLEAAIWNCCRHQCQFCKHYGAVVSCLHQGCLAKAHFICAHKQNWKMTTDFKSFCELHAEKDSSSSSSPAPSKAAVVPQAPQPTKHPKKEVKSNKELTISSKSVSLT